MEGAKSVEADDGRDFVLVLEENTKWPLLAETLAEIERENEQLSQAIPTSGNVLVVCICASEATCLQRVCAVMRECVIFVLVL